MRRVSPITAMRKLALIAPLMLLISASAVADPSQGLVLSPLAPELARSVAPGVPATAARGMASPYSALSVSGVAVSPYGVQAQGLGVFGDDAGGVVIAWSDMRNGNLDCFASKLDGNSDLASGWTAYGNPVSVASSSQFVLVASTDDAGGAFVLFTDNSSYPFRDLFLQHLTSTGALAGGYPADGKPLHTGNIFSAGIGPDGSGGLYLVWIPFGGTLHVERLDASSRLWPRWWTPRLSRASCGSTGIRPTAAYPTPRSSAPRAAVSSW